MDVRRIQPGIDLCNGLLEPAGRIEHPGVGDNRQKPFVQTGLRFSLIPGLLQIDATRGAQPNGIGQTTWTSFGLRYTPDRLF